MLTPTTPPWSETASGAWANVAGAVQRMGDALAQMLPQLVAATALLVVGVFVSWIGEIVARRLLSRFNIDETAARLSPAERGPLGKSRKPSRVISKVVFWILLLTFVLAAAEVLGFETVTGTMARLIAYLPNVVAAGLLLLVGVLLGRVASRLVASGAAASGIAQSERLGSLARVAIIALVLVLAFAQLGIETRILVTVLAVVLAGGFLTIGLAFGLGARPLVTHILAGHFLRQTLPTGHSVEVDGRRGTVERVGAVETRFRGKDGAWSVPNAVLLDQVVEHD